MVASGFRPQSRPRSGGLRASISVWAPDSAPSAEQTRPSAGRPGPLQAAFFPWSPRRRREGCRHAWSCSCRNLGSVWRPGFLHWPCSCIQLVSRVPCAIPEPIPLPASTVCPPCALSGTPGSPFLLLLTPPTVSLPHDTLTYLCKTQVRSHQTPQGRMPRGLLWPGEEASHTHPGRWHSAWRRV